eukprot:3925416-Pyramimonas_sp.AAC.1
MVHLRPHAHRLGEGRRARREHHQLLERERVARVRPAVDDVEGGNRKNEPLVPGEVREVLVQRYVTLRRARLAQRHRHGQDGVGAEVRLVRGGVEALRHQVVELGAGGGAGGAAGAEDALVGVHVRLGGGVPPRVEDLAAHDFGDATQGVTLEVFGQEGKRIRGPRLGARVRGVLEERD